MGVFKDPRMDLAFVRTWKSKEDYCAEEAIRRQEEIEALQKELTEYRKLGTVDFLRELLAIHTTAAREVNPVE